MNNFFRTKAGKYISIQEALEQKLIGLGASQGAVWVGGNQRPIQHLLEDGIIDQEAADFLAARSN